jgi:ATP-dependent helicase HrpB
VDGVGADVQVYLAEPLSEAEIRGAFPDQIRRVDEVMWDAREEAVVARAVENLGAIGLSSRAFVPPVESMRSCMIAGIQEMGLEALPWTPHARSVRARSEWLRSEGIVDARWPVLSDERLSATLEDWLGPYLDGITRRAHLAKLDLGMIIEASFAYDQLRQLELLAPTHLVVPTGSRIPLEYAAGSPPVLAVRLQEMFGQTETPAVCGGKVKVLLHLLSPARRPLAVTQDLPSFWNNAYPQVRKDMRGRYPKHPWPENPLEAAPTRRTKRR